MTYIRRFEQLSATDMALAGGKGANLGELTRAGFPVPPGFVLTTAAYRDFVQANDLQPAIAMALQDVAPGDPATWQWAATAIAGCFAIGQVPPAIAEALCQAYADLGGGPVAVRSSATAEDSATASFAGQQETFLSVTGEEAVLQATKRCWASLWTARAIAYRTQRGVPHDPLSLAVVVQRMVNAEAAGVLFTANPATGDPDEMVVNAVRGTGKVVVGGQVTPEEIILDRGTPTGRCAWAVSRRTSPDGPVLTVAQAEALARLGVRIEAHYGHPQDVEWAWADGRFHVLQARPVTTPLRPRLAWEPPARGMHCTRGGVMELMPDPVSVLFETLGLPAIEQGLREYQQQMGLGQTMQDWGFVTVNGYVYGRLDPWMGLTVLFALPRLLRQASRALDEWEQETLPAYRQEVSALPADPARLSAGELLVRMDALALAAGRYWSVIAAMVPQLDRAERRFALVYEKLRRPDDPAPAVFLRGFENRPLEAERALYAAREGDLDGYIAQYGHVLYNLDFAVPLAGEDRAALKGMLRAWQAGAPGPDERQARLAAEREAATVQVRERWPGWKRRFFDRLLSAAQRAAQVRENALFDLGLAWAPLRRYALALGRRLVAAGALNAPEQVFWLQRDELSSLVEKLDGGEPLPSLAEQAVTRQAEREAARGARVPFTLPVRDKMGLLALGVPTAEARRQVAGDMLTGAGTSPGTVTAVARVIDGPAEFVRLGQGQILVAHVTTPAWTPLFALAGGLVADLGGSLSHGSIVAREYGIPAVMGTGNATERICDGQLITVDGTAGKVYMDRG